MDYFNMDEKYPVIEKSQLHFGLVYHWILIITCLISLIAPVFILMNPESSFLDPYAVFNAVFEGRKASEIWDAAGVKFGANGFWKLFIKNIITPDGFAVLGIVAGCSVTLWALIPAVWQFIIKKDFFFVFVSIFIILLIALAMLGIS